ncbi:MAG: TonB-dependent receptor [Prolixibacteraceae bacterium]|nr:TonB-dependent receptor [Prolixibacteraceae bacterium]
MFQAGYSNYENRYYSLSDYGESDGRFEEYEFKSTMYDFFIRDIATFQFSEKSELEVGGEFILHHFAPSKIEVTIADSTYSFLSGQNRQANELNFFGDYFYAFNEKLNLKAGLRYSNYLGIKSFVEPRLQVKYMPDKTQAFSFSYNRVSQAMHLLTNPGLGFSTDIWLFSNEQIKPAVGNQFSLSWSKEFRFLNIPLSFSADAYYKSTINALEYRDGFSSNYFTSSNSFQDSTLTPYDITTSGQTDSYGIEFLLEKKEGRLTGWLSYTLAKSVSLFPELNKGIGFPSKYDRRHAFSISASYALNKKYQLSANWNYGSGLPLTIARYIYFSGFFDMETGSSKISSFQVPVNTDRNSYRMKATHTLNISASKKIKLFKMDGKLELGVYNLYYRKNPTYYTYGYRYLSDQSEQSNSRIYSPQVKMVSLLPILPYFNLSVLF